MKKNLTFKVCYYGLLGAEAIALAFFENLIPALPFMPPGAKLGFSNIVTMIAAYSLGLPSALYIVLIKAVFAFLTRGITAFFMSLCGGILSAIAMFLLFKIKNNKAGISGISVISAVMHNLGQFIVACFLVGSKAVFGYAPFLLIFGIFMGLITGGIMKVILPVINKQKAYYIKGG